MRVPLVFIVASLLTLVPLATATFGASNNGSPAPVIALPLLCDIPHYAACSDVFSLYEQPLRDQIQGHVDAFYDGRVLDPDAGPKPSNQYLADPLINKPTCNLLNSLYPNPNGSLVIGSKVPDAEVQLNHNGENCGVPCQIKCSQDLLTGMPDCTQLPTTCTLEQAWTRGVFVQIIQFELDDVLTELKDTKNLSVSERCSPPTSGFPDVEAQLKKSKKSWGDYWKITRDQAPPTCFEPSDNFPARLFPEIAIAACFLQSAEQSLESFIFETAVCEILVRSEELWLLFTALPDLTLNATAGDAYNKCVNKLPPQDPTAPPVDQSQQLSLCTNQEYQRNIQDSFLKIMDFGGILNKGKP